MKIRPEILDHWPEVSAHFPADFDFEATARARGACKPAREIKNAETLLRLRLRMGAAACRCARPVRGQRPAGSSACPIHRCSIGCGKRRPGVATPALRLLHKRTRRYEVP